ncbi:MAG: hypothetical protein ACRDT4_03565 [Micromonosporaceae bacterium]
MTMTVAPVLSPVIEVSLPIFPLVLREPVDAEHHQVGLGRRIVDDVRLLARRARSAS